MAKQAWMELSLCVTLTPQEADAIFFIGPGQSSKRAKVFCSGCPVKRNCNEYAVMYNESGLWAGTTEEDRRDLDPFIKDTLRAQAEAANRLESRNLNDFIPQQRPLLEVEVEPPLEVQGQWEEPQEVLDRLFG